MNENLSIVVGAGSGLGKAIARRLASRGEHVLLVGRTAKKLNDAREGLPEPTTYVFRPIWAMKAKQKTRLPMG